MGLASYIGAGLKLGLASYMGAGVGAGASYSVWLKLVIGLARDRSRASARAS